MCVCRLTNRQLHDAEDEFIDVETDDVDSMLNIFEEITTELLKEGEIVVCSICWINNVQF